MYLKFSTNVICFCMYWLLNLFIFFFASMGVYYKVKDVNDIHIKCNLKYYAFVNLSFSNCVIKKVLCLSTLSVTLFDNNSIFIISHDFFLVQLLFVDLISFFYILFSSFTLIFYDCFFPHSHFTQALHYTFGVLLMI